MQIINSPLKENTGHSILHNGASKDHRNGKTTPSEQQKTATSGTDKISGLNIGSLFNKFKDGLNETHNG
jgi:hypothetical protein